MMETPTPTRVTTLRLPEPLMAELSAVARADEIPMSQFVREAVEKRIEDRRADEDFQERLRQRQRENQAVLERLQQG
jgi:predicted DNA-binding protein